MADHDTAKRECAQLWVALGTEIAQKDELPAGTLQRIAWYARELILRRQKLQRKADLIRDFQNTTWTAERLCLGSTPQTWGLLSGGNLEHYGDQPVRLETTLRGMESAYSRSGVLPQLQRILATLPALRIKAELGEDSSLESALEDNMLKLINDPALSPKHRRGLIEHLPGHLRPRPDSLAELQRQQPPVTLWLTLYGPDSETYLHFSKEPFIHLDDIVIASGLRGRGLGTAVMTELCIYADHHQLPIQGEINPGPGDPDEAMGPLARWYFRHGFRVGSLEPPEWKRNNMMRREPHQ